MSKLREHRGLIVIVSVFLLVKLIFMFKPYLIGWDESVYIGMGKFMFSGGEIGLWEDIRPPGLPFIFGGGWALGFNPLEFGLALELLFSMGCLVLVYAITKKMEGKYAGLIAAGVLALTPIFFSASSQLLSSIPASFFVLLSVWLTLKKNHPFIIGIVVGLAFLVKFPAVLIGFIIGLYLIVYSVKSKKVIDNLKKYIKTLLLFVGGGLFTTLPFFVFNYAAYRSDTGSALDAVLRPLFLGSLHQGNIFHSINGSWSNWTFYVSTLFSSNPLLIFSLIGLVVLMYSQRKKAALVILPLVLFWLYFTIIINKQLRFALLFLPFITIVAGSGIFYLIDWLRKKPFSFMTRGTFLVIILFMLLIPLQEDRKIVEWLIDESHPLESFYSLPVEGPILTMLPMLSAHTNQLFFPAYDSPDIALIEYNKHKEEVNAVVWFSGFYPCVNDLCTIKKELLKDKIEEDFSVSHQFRYNDEEYVIFT